MTTIKKKFDCIAFKRSAQLSIYEEIKNMTRDEQMAYFRNRAESGPLGDWWKKQPIAGHALGSISSGLCAENNDEYGA